MYATAAFCSSLALRKYAPAIADQFLHFFAHLLRVSTQTSNELLASAHVRFRIVLCAPKDDVKENGNEVQASLSQGIEVLPSVDGTRCLGENSLLLKTGKAGSQDICCESFFRF